ncbi:hypothetical protein GPA10_05115 [Streptomyces sp. p1417]|uniref:Uncharacterized protein n=1 Tax=Streptomyces typhae TaxID=2681492 RepID=A0A6L6WUX9_9ACTN|nr:DUF6221 family protein [Streptomyces typhae]MVO84166.1 hypothetical protein [Streptomyces typhae]
MDDLVRWLGEQLDVDTEAARAAMVTLGDVEWYVTQDSDVGQYSVRSEPTCRAVARVSRIDGDSGERAAVLDGRAAAEHIATWGPARVLREIDAKRRILAEHALNGWACTTCDNGEVEQVFPCPTLRLLALPYADRPGYREEWRP